MIRSCEMIRTMLSLTRLRHSHIIRQPLLREGVYPDCLHPKGKMYAPEVCIAVFVPLGDYTMNIIFAMRCEHCFDYTLLVDLTCSPHIAIHIISVRSSSFISPCEKCVSTLSFLAWKIHQIFNFLWVTYIQRYRFYLPKIHKRYPLTKIAHL